MTPTVKILVLTFYYPPDLSACSFRIGALMPALLRRLPPGAEVHVITTAPNRYHAFSVDVPSVVQEGPLSIHRIRVPPHRSGMFDQMRAFMVFARAVGQLVKGSEYSLVYATSSRLMTAALGARVARRLRVPLYLDIRDLFADTMDDVLPRAAALPLRPVLSLIERWTIGRAARVNLVSGGFESYFAARYPRQAFSFFTNGVDDEFVLDATEVRQETAREPIRVLYAGNIGEGQGLHSILPAIATRLNGRVTFRVIGDGGRRLQLEDSLARAGVLNVDVVAPMSRAALIGEYREATVLFLHLNDYAALARVLPSKIFEYGALGKPIWAGVSGYAAKFLRDEVSNVSIFPPCDADEALRAFDRLAMHDAPRSDFVAKYSRKLIMGAMAADVLGHATDE